MGAALPHSHPGGQKGPLEITAFTLVHQDRTTPFPGKPPPLLIFFPESCLTLSQLFLKAKLSTLGNCK